MPDTRPLPQAADHGASLRALYETQGGVRSIFSAKVADYVASRPDYPVALFAALQAHAGLGPGCTVADVGAGTGLLTQGLLQRGCRAIAVEPNEAMRAAADALLGDNPAYRSVHGSAEHMPLADGSVDLITAAQAFHWFEVDAARAECLRVLQASGRVALIWNDRRSHDPLHDALDDLFNHHGGAKRAALLAHEDRAEVPRFFGTGPRQEFSWPHEHALAITSLTSLVLSRSYMPARGSSAALEVEAKVQNLFGRLAAQGRVMVRYTTVAMLGRPA